MKYPSNNSININSVVIIGTYQPRRCGIATFSADLVQSLSPHPFQCYTIALNDKPEGYDYPDEVSFEINEEELSEYRKAAKYLTIKQPDIICLQHEFGIFGGNEGEYILSLLKDLSTPVVTTLHTILTNPDPRQKEIIMELAGLSDRLVVMSRTAVNILHSVYDVPKDSIRYIPHGIPDIPFVDPNYYKEQFDLLGKDVLLTFGLLSATKGIEYVIKGLADVIDQFPDLRYIILGETHPNVLASEGEKYRKYLQQLVQELGLEKNVIFENKFADFDELCTYLEAADVYITPYLNKEQITSGTLAYAAGTGKAVISTPYLYAKEMLADQRGRLVPFKDKKAIGKAITELFEDDAKRHQMRKQAYDYSRNAIWSEVGKQYAALFRKVRATRSNTPHPSAPPVKEKTTSEMALPKLKLDHLLRLTDDTGIVQHATYTIPNRSYGYCTDDNARALTVVLQAKDRPHLHGEQASMNALIDRYLTFLLHAFNPDNERFRNFMSYSGRWQNEAGSEDAQSRALWALGNAIEADCHLSLSAQLFMRALPKTETFQSPRALAFTLLGIHSYGKAFPGDSTARRIAEQLAGILLEKFTVNSNTEWPWPENLLTYCNGKLPHALLVAGHSMKNSEMIEQGMRSLDWLMNVQIQNGQLSPIGNHGWYSRGGKKAHFDQQPIEASTLLEACAAAYDINGNDYWLNKALTCFNWFLGHNDMHRPLHNVRSGGCHDGLQSNGVNQNEGAESTLAWLQALISMQKLMEKKDNPDSAEVIAAS